MKNLLMFILILGVSLGGFSQELFTVSGVISNMEGEPIPGVNVIIKGTDDGAQSNIKGEYKMMLAAGNYTLVFSSITTVETERSFDLSAPLILNVILESQIQSLDEVLVNAVRVDATSPITHSNLDEEEIEKRNLGQDLPVLMNYLPAVVTTTDAGAGIGYTGIRVRGINAQSTNVTINGIPYNDAESMGTFWVNLGDFASSVESLQLQRGVGTSTNGSGAFGASINVLTDAISPQENAEISNSFGSFNTRKHTLKFSTGLINDKFEFAGRLSNISSDGYIDRAETDLKSYFLQASYIDENTLIKAISFGGREITYQSWYGLEDPELLENDRTFNVAGIYFDDEGNMRFYDNEVDNYSQDHYQLHLNQKISDRLSAIIGLNYTYGRGYFEQYKEDESFQDYDITPITIGSETIDETDLIRRRWLDNDFYVINANLQYKTDRITAILGSSYSTYDGEHFGEIIWAQYASDSEIRDRYYEGNGKKNDFSLFGKTTYNINEDFSLYADVQVRNVTYKTTGLDSDRLPFIVDKNYTFFNPKAGLTYALNNKNSLYFSYARANREPNRDDFQNNANVKPEQLNDFELGWRHRSEKFSLGSNAYLMLYNEQLVLTGELDDVGNPVRTNSGESYRLGLEIDASIKILDKLEARPNIALSTNKNKNTVVSRDGGIVDLGSTNISYSPEIVAANALIYKPTENLQFSFLSKYVGDQYLGNTDSDFSKLDSYFINDLNASFEIDTNSFIKSLVFTALVNNIFNVEYISNGYYYTYDDDFSTPGVTTTIEGAGFYPQATINFLFGMSLKF